MERDAELRKSQDEAGVEMLGRAEHASSEIGGRLPHKLYGSSCIGVLQKEEKHCKENTNEGSYSYWIFYHLKNADQALFSSRLSKVGWPTSSIRRSEPTLATNRETCGGGRNGRWQTATRTRIAGAPPQLVDLCQKLNVS